MATAGYTLIGASTAGGSESNGSGNGPGMYISVPQPILVTKISVYCIITIASWPSYCYILGGAPGAVSTIRKATSLPTNIPTSYAWTDFNFATPVPVMGDCWIEFQGYGGQGPGESVASWKYDSGGLSNGSFTRTDIGNAGYGSHNHSMYMTYTLAADLGGLAGGDRAVKVGNGMGRSESAR